MTESIWFSDALMKVHVAPEDAAGAYALIEVLAPPGHRRPLHVHELGAESLLVLEGEITLDTPAGTTTVRPGEVGHVRGGEAHSIRVTSAGPARAVLVSAAADVVDELRAGGRPAAHAALPTPTTQLLEVIR